MGPKYAEIRPKVAENGAKLSQVGANWPHDAPKLAPNATRTKPHEQSNDRNGQYSCPPAGIPKKSFSNANGYVSSIKNLLHTDGREHIFQFGHRAGQALG